MGLEALDGRVEATGGKPVDREAFGGAGSVRFDRRGGQRAAHSSAAQGVEKHAVPQVRAPGQAVGRVGFVVAPNEGSKPIARTPLVGDRGAKRRMVTRYFPVEVLGGGPADSIEECLLDRVQEQRLSDLGDLHLGTVLDGVVPTGDLRQDGRRCARCSAVATHRKLRQRPDRAQDRAVAA